MSTALPSAATTTTILVFIDQRVAGWRALVEGLPPGSAWQLVDADADGLAQIAAALAGRDGVQTLHIVSHGTQGSVQLGATTLSAQTLQAHADQLAAIGAALGEGGDILLYGCEAGAGSAGAALLEGLAALTGADVAASTDATGAAALGGNWVLERSVGGIEAAALDGQGMPGLLAGPVVFDFSSGTVIADTDIDGGGQEWAHQILGGHTLIVTADRGYLSVVDEDAIMGSNDPVLNGKALAVDFAAATWPKEIDLRLGGRQTFDLKELTLLDTVGDLQQIVITNNRGQQVTIPLNAGSYQGQKLYLQGRPELSNIEWAKFTDPYGGTLLVAFDDIKLDNILTPPSFAGFGSPLKLQQNAGPFDFTSELLVDDPDAGQTLSWSVVTAPAHATLQFGSYSAQSGGSNIAPNGAPTYQPHAGYAGLDWFVVRVSDGLSTDEKTIFVSVAPLQPGVPDLDPASDIGLYSDDDYTGAATLSFHGSSAAGDSSSTVLVFIDANDNGSYEANDPHGTAIVNNGAWTVNNISTAGLNGSYNVYAFVTPWDNSASSALGTPLSVKIASSGPALSFGDIRLSNDTGTSDSDFHTRIAQQTISATLSRPLAEGEQAFGSLDGSAWTAFTGEVSGTTLTWQNVTLTAGGQIQLKVRDQFGKESTPSLRSYQLDQTAPAITVTGAAFGTDSGGDFILNAASQTLSGTLSGALGAGNFVEVSLDGGASWRSATASAASQTWSLAGLSLAGSNTLQVRVSDAAGNVQTPYSRAYVLDQAAPTASLPAVSQLPVPSGSSFTVTVDYADTGGSGLDAASFGTGNIGVTGPGNASLAVTGFSASGGQVSYTVAAPGGSWDALDAGLYTVAIKANSVRDVAGNAVAANASAATIEVTFSTAPAISALRLSADNGPSGSDFVTNAALQTVRATLSKALAPGDRVQASLDNGASWTDVTDKVSGTELAWDGVMLPASGTLVVRALDSTNTPAAAASHAYVLDAAAPSQTIASVALVQDSGSPGDFITRVAQQSLAGTLSAPLNADEFVEVSLDNGASWTTAASSGIAWALNGFTLPSSGTAQVRVSDLAGNHGTAWSHGYLLDTAAPLAGTPVRADMRDPGGSGFSFTVNYADSGAGIDPATVGSGNVSVTGPGGALTVTGATLAGNTVTYMVAAPGGAWDPLDAGSYTIGINAGIKDLAGNTVAANAAAHTFTVSFNTPPTATITMFDTSLGAGESSLLTVTFSEAVTGFTAADLTIPDATLGPLTTGNGGRTWTAIVTPNAGVALGTHQVLLDLGGVTDLEGLAGSGLVGGPVYTVTTVRPTATLSVLDTALTAGESTTLTVTFSEAVTGFTAADLSAANATVSNLASSDGGITWTATLTPAANTWNGANTVSLDLGGVMNAAGNGGSGSVQSNAYAVQTGTPPAPPEPPGVVIDGVRVIRGSSFDPATGLVNDTTTVPIVGATRPGDLFADIPLVAAGPGAGSSLLVGLPAGAGLQANGPLALLSKEGALLDLIHRIEQKTADGSGARAGLQGGAAAFLGALAGDTLVQTLSINPQANGDSSAHTILLSGAGTGQGAAIGLVIDTSQLARGTTLQLDHVDFAAVIGAATLRGGLGDNIVVGDGASQNIFLGEGDDQLYGGAGDDILGSAGGDDLLDGGSGRDRLAGGIGHDRLDGGAGDDVLQGGRSAQGGWQFTIRADGSVEARHQTALFAPSAAETLAPAQLDRGAAELAFLSASRTALTEMALLYGAAFDRAPDLGGLNFYLSHGVGAATLARAFLDSNEWKRLETVSDAAFVARLYEQTLDRAGDLPGLAFWTAQLAAGTQSRADVLLAFALSAEHRARYADGLVIAQAEVARENGWILGSGDDRLQGGAGSDLLVGGDGVDTVVYAGARGDYRFLLGQDGSLKLAEKASLDVDTLVGIERGEFRDGALDLAFTQAAPASLATVGLLYQAVLDRSGDLAGLAGWAGAGLDTATLARAFAASGEFAARYGAMSDTAFVAALYANSGLDLAAAGGSSAWVAMLHDHSRAELIGAWIAQDAVREAQFAGQGLWLA